MSTDPRQQAQPQVQQEPQPIAGEDTGSPTGQYLNSLNALYQGKLTKWAKLPNYTIHFRKDGKEDKQVYERMKILQHEFDEIEDLRTQSVDLERESKYAAWQKSKEMYRKAASYTLFNPKTQRPMTEEEYKYCHLEDIRPAIDSALLIALISETSLN
jgi:hypothetical protein